MKTFKDLEFKEHDVAKSAKIAIKRGIDMSDYVDAKQAKITFDNGKSLSVIFGECFYSNGIDTYEAMELSSDNDPKGYLTEQEVTEYMMFLQSVEIKDNA